MILSNYRSGGCNLIQLSTDEPPRLQAYYKKYLEALPARCKERYIQLRALDVLGKNVLVTRFIRPQNSPPGFQTLDQIKRYVSMIPYISDRLTYGANCSLWSTCQVRHQK